MADDGRAKINMYLNAVSAERIQSQSLVDDALFVLPPIVEDEAPDEVNVAGAGLAYVGIRQWRDLDWKGEDK